MFNEMKRDIATIRGIRTYNANVVVDKFLLASIVIPWQRQRLRGGRDRRRRPTVEQRWPVAGGGSRMLPITS